MSKFDEILDKMIQEKSQESRQENPNIALEGHYLVRFDNDIMSGIGLIPAEQIEDYADEWEKQEKLIAKFTE